MKILVTGATGFIGSALSTELLNQGFDLTVALRNKSDLFTGNTEQVIVGNLDNNIDWMPILENIDCIIHLAGKAHIKDSEKSSTLDEFHKINTESTLNLANQAAVAGVNRFVFISSIGVNGNTNTIPFTENDIPNPQEPYAASKYKAEQGLFKIANETDLDVVIIRPPLVYGSNAPGNLGRLIKWSNCRFPIPLPLGSIKNSRSLLALDNLVDFIIICSIHKKASNEIFLIADGDDISTTELLQNLKLAFEKKAWLIPIPVNWIAFILKLIGREADAVRLFSSLRIDSTKARELLGWKPKITMNKALLKIADETSI
jgi:nucleoside-diphosphate-sugar epimerase